MSSCSDGRPPGSVTSPGPSKADAGSSNKDSRAKGDEEKECKESATSRLPPEAHPGDRFGDYVVKSKLGVGSYGRVYHCYAPRQHRTVVVKEVTRVLNGRSVPSEQLRWEADAMRQVAGHTGVVELVEWLEENGRSFLVTENCEGGDLFQKVPFFRYCWSRQDVVSRVYVETASYMNLS